MFGDNQAVITNDTVPHSTLQKRWHMLAYHRVREAVAAGFVRFLKIDGKENPADILTKHWDLPSVWGTLKGLLFWEGDTETIKAKYGLKKADCEEV